MEIHATVKRWLVAVAAPLVAAMIALALNPYLPPRTTPPYMLAIMVAAAYGGAGPGVLATGIATACLVWFDFGNTGSFVIDRRDLIDMAVFLTASLLISSLAAARTAAQKRLRDALAELSAADRAKDEFIATLSHELRTPLTSIAGWTAILQKNGIDGETRALAVQSIAQSTRTQKMLVDDLLDVSRIVLGKLHVHREVMDLNEPVAEALDLIAPAAEARSLRLGRELAREPLVVCGDAQRLKQVVWNLLSNAVKFTPAGGEITLTSCRRGDLAVIEVRDNGEGIDPAVLPQLFERFRQGASGPKKGGLGIGLSVSRFIVEEHGGSVRAQSEGIGRGTVVTVKIPLEATKHSSGAGEHRPPS